MRYLEDVLSSHQTQKKFVLTQDILKAKKAVEDAAQVKVSVWNSPASKTAPTPSPARTLPSFLPPKEGGLDKTGRLEKFEGRLVPLPKVVENYKAMKLTVDFPTPALANLLDMTRRLFLSYCLEPNERFLRGETSDNPRLKRIRAVLENEDFAVPADNAVFLEKLAAWRKRVNDAYGALVRKEEQGQARVNSIWGEDQYLMGLLKADSDNDDFMRHSKRMPSMIVLGNSRDALKQCIAYLGASAEHEKAAQFQASLDASTQLGKATKREREDARTAWANAQGAWQGFRLSLATVSKRVDDIQERVQLGDVEAAVNLWEQLHRDLAISIDARLRQAEAQRHTTGAKAAQQTLGKLADDLDTLLDGKLLRAKGSSDSDKWDIGKELSLNLEKLRVTPLRARLELLTHNWGERGNFHFVRAAVRLQLKTDASATRGPAS